MKLNSLKFFDGFILSDLKYLMAYSIPLTAIFGFYMGGYWLLTTPIYIFLIIPIIEHLLTFLKIDDLEKGRINKSTHRIFDLMLYINIPLVYGILIYALIFLRNKDLFSVEFFTSILTVGLLVGTNGINVAHELCHRSKKYEKFLGKFLLIPSLYMHFYLEHIFGHHLNVATKEDPVTAKYNQPLYSFWISAIKGEILSAIEIQKKRLDKNNLSFFSVYNDMFWYSIIQSLYILIVFAFFNLQGIIFVLSVAMISILIFECVNYIEHYGLLRKKLSNGRYERVTDMHSWNSNHILGRIVLYELTRHSDHHRISVTKYQNLKSIDKSPQLAFGYPTSILLSFIPVLWFKIMNPRIPKQMFQTETNNN